MSTGTTNPWQPGYACPFALIGLNCGLTVHVHITGGPVITGTLYAINQAAIVIDSNADRAYIPMGKVDGVHFEKV